MNSTETRNDITPDVADLDQATNWELMPQPKPAWAKSISYYPYETAAQKMRATPTQQAMSGLVDPVLARSSADLQAAAAKVVVSDAGIEIHGYVVTCDGNHVRVVWAVASGRHRQRTFKSETVFQPGDDRRWDGYLIPHERLAAIRQVAR
ncbi:hypothetical protein CVV68_22495 [Arthrobacter livingstonensis]|uniref:Uncharacterized protein n=1 Tax=Arthrobacter livingstonensis TaxID=670078 RepID=A0A2V5L184_9MICC|nr:hypothetical protein [Arthrobacter livingstonensis]PYI64232.1 hypothetical protein CVV68_22495 [Arthrobacter livingstonensis]